MTQIYAENLQNQVIDIATSGDNTLIAAPATGYIAVDFITLLPTTAVSVTLKRNSTALSGPLPLDAKQPFTFENTFHNEKGILNCNPGEAFIINLGGAVQCGGFIKYRIIGR